jgi:hypothetical protein
MSSRNKLARITFLPPADIGRSGSAEASENGGGVRAVNPYVPYWRSPADHFAGRLLYAWLLIEPLPRRIDLR